MSESKERTALRAIGEIIGEATCDGATAPTGREALNAVLEVARILEALAAPPATSPLERTAQLESAGDALVEAWAHVADSWQRLDGFSGVSHAVEMLMRALGRVRTGAPSPLEAAARAVVEARRAVMHHVCIVATPGDPGMSSLTCEAVALRQLGDATEALERALGQGEPPTGAP